MWNHTSDGLVQDSGWGSEVEWTLGLVVSGGLSQVVVVLELVSEELTGDVEGLASDNDNLLAVEDLLGNNGSQTAQQVALSVNDNNRFERGHGV